MSTQRTAQATVDPIFIERWSPRVFSDQVLSGEEIQSLFEAARWAPSSYNDQPWLFLYAQKKEDHKRFASLLVDANRVWAERAPLLVYVCARKGYRRNDKPNRHYAFDSGAAWMSLALAAHKLGLYCHAMGGFDHDASYGVLGIPKTEYEVMAAIAIGRLGNGEGLVDEIRDGDKERSDRRPLAEVAIEGRF